MNLSQITTYSVMKFSYNNWDAQLFIITGILCITLGKTQDEMREISCPDVVFSLFLTAGPDILVIGSTIIQHFLSSPLMHS